MKERFANLALATLSVVVLLVIMEIGFRAAGYSTLAEIYSSADRFWQHDELRGWVHRAHVSTEFVGPLPWPVEFESLVTLDGLGLRDHGVERAGEGVLRVLFTGDSRTAGFEVADDETFSALLGPILGELLGRPVQTYNAGVRGYGTDQCLLGFREQWRVLEPDLVVHLHSFNDPIDNIVLHQARRIYGKAAFRLSGEEDVDLIGAPIPVYDRCAEVWLVDGARTVRYDTVRTRSVCTLHLALVDRSALLSFLHSRIEMAPDLHAFLKRLRTSDAVPERRQYEHSDVPSRGGEVHYELTRRLLRRFAREVQEAGGRFVVAGYGTGIAELGVEEVRARGVDVLDISEIEDGDPMAIRFVNDGHWNALGHRRVAEALAPHLAQRLESPESPLAGPAPSYSIR